MNRQAVVALLLTAMILGGCAGSRAIRVPDAHTTGDVDRLIRDEVRTWEGTPHEWGGATRAGADCSGFVMRVYDDLFGLSIPRTTEDQARLGEKVSSRSLMPGDLVFFRTGPKLRHVGVYLSDGEFAHASSSRGVSISNLESEYWQRAYWMSRRVLAPPAADARPPLHAQRPAPERDQPAPEHDQPPPERDQPPPVGDAVPAAGTASMTRIGW